MISIPVTLTIDQYCTVIDALAEEEAVRRENARPYYPEEMRAALTIARVRRHIECAARPILRVTE